MNGRHTLGLAALLFAVTIGAAPALGSFCEIKPPDTGPANPEEPEAGVSGSCSFSCDSADRLVEYEVTGVGTTIEVTSQYTLRAGSCEGLLGCKGSAELSSGFAVYTCTATGLVLADAICGCNYPD